MCDRLLAIAVKLRLAEYFKDGDAIACYDQFGETVVQRITATLI
ncbi:hypothetical protein [Kamptonema sp. UHCC 0994]|nr:hypothetical protein [Kamptonema sp. UHCC 0994]MDF0554946.1 hypothetical protein [Kamptonema sp. UHCC 0994]